MAGEQRGARGACHGASSGGAAARLGFRHRLATRAPLGLEALMQFTTNVAAARANVTGIPIPSDVIEALGGGQKPAVVLTLAGASAPAYTYRSTVGVMGGQHLVPLSSEHRKASGLAAGDEIDVTIELDEAPRTVELDPLLASALDAAGLRAAFDALSRSRQRQLADPVGQTKNDETKQRRVDKALEALRS
jgi:hypothetical protein